MERASLGRLTPKWSLWSRTGKSVRNPLVLFYVRLCSRKKHLQRSPTTSWHHALIFTLFVCIVCLIVLDTWEMRWRRFLSLSLSHIHSDALSPLCQRRLTGTLRDAKGWGHLAAGKHLIISQTEFMLDQRGNQQKSFEFVNINNFKLLVLFLI